MSLRIKRIVKLRVFDYVLSFIGEVSLMRIKFYALQQHLWLIFLTSLVIGVVISQKNSLAVEVWRAEAHQACLRNINDFGNGVEKSPSIREGVCGLQNPLKVTHLGGVKFYGDARFSCPVVKTTREWLRDIAKPAAVKHRKSALVAIKIAASYACRSRNRVKGARISEHAFANAIDISAFYFADGTIITVKEGWRKSSRSSEKKFLQDVFHKVCGPFTTIIGPDGDRYHQDHFHFDKARRGKSGNGTWCR
jgi:hypothetical protein